ncbi:MAG: YrzE family protein [Clostridia bacterium]|nr:YrzE family protein [Clostridia bacterium]
MKNRTGGYSGSSGAGAGNQIFRYLISLGIALTAPMILALIFTFYSSTLPDPDKYLTPFGLITIICGALAGGVASVRLTDGGLFSGTVVGGIYSLIAFILRVILSSGGGGVGPWLSILLYAVLVLASVVGAYLGRSRGTGRSRNRKIKKLKS